MEKSDERSGWLLRSRREWPCDSAAQKRNELAPPHVPPRPRPRKSGSKANTQRLVRYATRCPLWVKSRHRSTSSQCLLYPRKRTSFIFQRDVACRVKQEPRV